MEMVGLGLIAHCKIPYKYKADWEFRFTQFA